MDFTTADSVDSDTNAGEPLVFQGLARVNTDTDVLQSSVNANGSAMKRASAEIIAHHAFTLDPGNGFDTLLFAQVGGSVNMKGFLYIVGIGQTDAEVALQVRDITDSADGPVVKRYAITKHELEGEFAPSAKAGIGIEGGEPYAGAKINLGVDTELSIDWDVVDETKDFGFDAWLQRGHTYDLELVIESGAKLGGVAGVADATFFSSGSSSTPDVASPDVWLGPTTEFTSSDLPNFPIPREPLTGSGSYHFPKVKTWFGTYGGVNAPVGLNFTMDPLGRNFSSTNQVLDFLSIPHNVPNLSTNYLGLGTRTMNTTMADVASPGVQLTALHIAVEQDKVERLTQIESLLAAKTGQSIPKDLPTTKEKSLPVLTPGATLSFSAPDDTDTQCNGGNGYPTTTAPGTCLADYANGKLLSLDSCVGNAKGASSHLAQWNDFTVDAGTDPDTAVLTQVTGSVTLHGFLVLLGLGKAGMDVNMVVRDITDVPSAPETGTIVMSQPADTREIVGKLHTAAGGDLTFEGGAPFAGAELGLGLNIGVTARRKSFATRKTSPSTRYSNAAIRTVLNSMPTVRQVQAMSPTDWQLPVSIIRMYRPCRAWSTRQHGKTLSNPSRARASRTFPFPDRRLPAPAQSASRRSKRTLEPIWGQRSV